MTKGKKTMLLVLVVVMILTVSVSVASAANIYFSNEAVGVYGRSSRVLDMDTAPYYNNKVYAGRPWVASISSFSGQTANTGVTIGLVYNGAGSSGSLVSESLLLTEQKWIRGTGYYNDCPMKSTHTGNMRMVARQDDRNSGMVAYLGGYFNAN